MQLSTKESDAEQFQDYLDKTFCKTASLFANTCKAVSNDENVMLELSIDRHDRWHC